MDWGLRKLEPEDQMLRQTGDELKEGKHRVESSVKGAFEGWYGTLLPWTLPKIYEGNAMRFPNTECLS